MHKFIIITTINNNPAIILMCIRQVGHDRQENTYFYDKIGNSIVEYDHNPTLSSAYGLILH